MAVSQWKDIRLFEFEQLFIPETFIVIQLKIYNFSSFQISNNLQKPFDDKLFRLIQACGREVRKTIDEVTCFFGNDQEISIIFKRNATCHSRRRDKLVSTITSIFSSSFPFFWPKFYESQPLQVFPVFIAKGIALPNRKTMRKYLVWRQDEYFKRALDSYTEIVLIRAQNSTEEIKSFSISQKNEILFTHGINFNSLPTHHRMGIFTICQKGFKESSVNFKDEKVWKSFKDKCFSN